MTQSIISKHGVENMASIRGLADAFFIDSQAMYKTKVKIFGFSYVLPFIIHFFINDQATAFGMLLICQISLMVLMINDVIQMKFQGAKTYFKSL